MASLPRDDVSLDEEVAVFLKGAAECIAEAELRARLEAARKEKRALRVKLGADPSAPDIHLGHGVVLTKLRQIQDLGHEVTFLIGDFTGMIGDPTGKNETRPALTREEVEANARTYQDQIFKILDPERTTVRFNSEWLSPMNFADVIRLAGKATVAHMLERQDFGNRYRENRPIHLHEFFYSLAQGYDSIALESDLELGGMDQRFNFVTTRDLQRAYGQPPEIALMMPILNGLAGKQKMSKSLGNYIGIDESGPEMFGKAMSISDELMWEYWLLLTDRTVEDIDAMKARVAGGENPMGLKKELASTLVARFHGEAAGAEARAHFEQTVQRGEDPDDMPEVSIGSVPEDKRVAWALLAHCFGCSTSEARRMVKGGAAKLDGEKIASATEEVALAPGQVLRMGKRKRVRFVE